DLFYPLGMDNRKKLSDFFIDQKVSVADKGHATVLEAGGDIIWVIGHRIDNRYKVTDNTKRVVQFTVHPIF
ncbi:MAG: tRNA lysidine(34) synthetase TilS, partial [Cyclobacteriaceae bacterium]